MIKNLGQWWQSFSSETTKIIEQDDIKLVTVMLLFEVVLIDDHFDETEREQLQSSIAELFKLEGDIVDELILEAHKQHHISISLHDLTKKINHFFQNDEKKQIMVHLWRLAYADGHLDKYEEHVIRRISELIYIRHADFIWAKHQAQEQQQ